MGWKCSAPGCRQGYDGTPKNTTVLFHSFPRFNVPPNLELESKWESAIPRQKTFTKNSRLCSLHFTESDYITHSVDQRQGSGRQLNRQLGLRRLKKDAVPSVWPNLPPVPRPTRASTGGLRLHFQNKRKEALGLKKFGEEKGLTVNELHDKLSLETLPSEFILIKSPKLALVKLGATEGRGLDIKASLEIQEDLTFRIFQGHHKLSNSLVSHCLTTKANVIKSVTEVINIAAYLG
ncbi:uncharacterized protein [Lepeophtheirus salmonis]|uniref:uncharacterized protein n=1 Tax=Lepeophtheirus salmonis TaxID=72036 RepID=UPI001AEB88FF|nr:uncharacterized protein LOC121123594 [Lepeophtheirus salmonis]